MIQSRWVFAVFLVFIIAPTYGQRTALDRLHLLIPGAAGGGWDRTARGVGEALLSAHLAQRVTFENMSGGGGGRAIAHLLEIGDHNTLMVNSTPIVVRALQKVFPQSFRDLTPVASMIGDYSVIAVRARAPTRGLVELATAMRHEPRAVAIAGGSVRGGTDHIVAAMVFKGFGIAPADVKYIPYDAGGKAMAGLLSGEVQALSSGYGEVVDLVEQGWVRILCIAADTRQAFVPHVPTCIEAGAKNATFVNWRGFFAAPAMPAAQVALIQDTLQALTKTPAWQAVRDRYGWVDLHRRGAAFHALLLEQETRLQSLLTELELLP